jgi:hypothetical protein
MLLKVFALTAVIGLPRSAAFVANHLHPVMACASACGWFIDSMKPIRRVGFIFRAPACRLFA